MIGGIMFQTKLTHNANFYNSMKHKYISKTNNMILKLPDRHTMIK